jgi:hypothetical protein
MSGKPRACCLRRLEISTAFWSEAIAAARTLLHLSHKFGFACDTMTKEED